MNKNRKPNAISRARIEAVPQAEWDNLKRFQQEASKIRGWTPLEERTCINGYFSTARYIFEHYGVSFILQALHIGLSERTIDLWMHRHGYGKNFPSQHSYEHVEIDKYGRRGVVKPLPQA